MSHTPGPWKFKVVDETDSFLGCKRLDGGGGSTVIDLSNEWAGYPECGQDLQMTISKDDAALIAAAADMLRALEAARKFISNGVEFGYIWMPEDGDPALETSGIIEAAIRKARGEEC